MDENIKLTEEVTEVEVTEKTSDAVDNELSEDTVLEDALAELTREDDEEDEEEENEELVKKPKKANKAGSSYGTALRAVVFGALSIALPSFSLLFYCFGSYLLSIVAGAAAVAVAVIALMAATKANAVDEATTEMSKLGKILSIIGLIVSALVLVYVLSQILITVLVLGGLMIFYVFMFIIGIATGMMA